MPYEFNVDEWWCLEAAHIYCEFNNIPYDLAAFSAVVQQTQGATYEDKIVVLLGPILQHYGFQIGDWFVKVFDAQYIHYQGFPPAFGSCYIVFEPDAIVTTTEQATFTRIDFTNPAIAILAALHINGGFEPVTIVRMDLI